MAVVRELREELDVGATVGRALGEVPNVWEHDGVEHREVNHVYVAALDAADVVSHESHLAAGWVRLDELERIDVRPRVLVDLVLGLPR
jgi:8-oxo-dGTP diphosphatase